VIEFTHQQARSQISGWLMWRPDAQTMDLALQERGRPLDRVGQTMVDAAQGLAKAGCLTVHQRRQPASGNILWVARRKQGARR
jgi:hypothetical protein